MTFKGSVTGNSFNIPNGQNTQFLLANGDVTTLGDLTFAAGKFTATKYSPKSALTVNIPTKTSHLENDSSFATQSWVTGQITSATNPYTLPAATSSTLGGIMVGSGLNVTSAGVLSVSSDYATQSWVKSQITSATNPYTLPTATVSRLGGVMVGNGLSVTTDGTLSVNTSTVATRDWVTQQGYSTLDTNTWRDIKCGNVYINSYATLTVTAGTGLTASLTTSGTLTLGVDSTIATQSWVESKGYKTTDTNTWRPVYVDGTSFLTNVTGSTTSSYLNIKHGTGMTISTDSSKNITFAVDTNTIATKSYVNSAVAGASSTYTLPKATASQLGGVMISGDSSASAYYTTTGAIVDVNFKNSTSTLCAVVTRVNVGPLTNLQFKSVSSISGVEADYCTHYTGSSAATISSYTGFSQASPDAIVWTNGVKLTFSNGSSKTVKTIDGIDDVSGSTLIYCLTLIDASTIAVNVAAYN